MSKSRSLNSNEIEDIVNALPKVQAATKKCSDNIRTQIQNFLRNQLSEIKIIPEGIPKLKEYIIQQHYNSLVSAGEPVGIRAAEAIGQPTTQLALDSFHSAGKESEIGTGIVSIKELYNMSQKRSTEYITMHFKNKFYTFEDIIDLRRKIVGVMADDLILKKQYIPYNGMIPNNYWYNFYTDLTGKKIPKCTTYLRVQFDKVKLYAFNITPQDIAQKIENSQITCIPSPAYEGIVDFYPNDENIIESIAKKTAELSITEENASFLFLHLIFSPNLKDTLISGIKGITQLTPKSKPVSALIKSETQLGPARWRMDLDTIMQFIDGIPVEKLTKLIQMCGIKIVEQTPTYYVVDMPEMKTVEGKFIMDDGETVLEENRPQALINKKVSDDKSAMNRKTEEEKKQGIFKRQEVTELGRTAFYLYGLTNGSNLVDVLANNMVDSRYTKSNNPHEMNKALGIEATRNFLILEYLRNFPNAVEPRHIMLCVDFQTSLGVLLPITSRGAARQQTGPLAKGSFEHAMITFLEAAAFGKYEEVKSTSTSIFVGKRMVLGTGSFKGKLDKEAIQIADMERKNRIGESKDSYLTSSAQRALLHNFDIDGIELNPTEDMIGEHPVTEIIGTNTKVARLKIKNKVPVTMPIGIEIPASLKLIFRRLHRKDSKSIATSPRATSPKRQTLSKPGLPAIVESTPTQILNRKTVRKTPMLDIDLDAFLEDI
jgi:DNA-directed RNA polymerase beta' subunit